jgi:DNA-binding transcriptional MerR regulator
MAMTTDQQTYSKNTATVCDLDDQQLLKIGDIAEMTGLTLRTLRYYEEMQLIVPDARSKGNFRLYSNKVLNKLRFIDSLKRLDLTLTEIRELLPADGHLTDEDIIKRTRKALEIKQKKIEDRLAELTAMKSDVAFSLTILEDCVRCQAQNPHPCETNCDHKASHIE